MYLLHFLVYVNVVIFFSLLHALMSLNVYSTWLIFAHDTLSHLYQKYASHNSVFIQKLLSNTKDWKIHNYAIQYQSMDMKICLTFFLSVKTHHELTTYSFHMHNKTIVTKSIFLALFGKSVSQGNYAICWVCLASSILFCVRNAVIKQRKKILISLSIYIFQK